MFFVALVLRLIVASFLIGDHLDPARDHWKFGWETGRLARSLASGCGFSSPIFGDTGPSAWMAPLYPLLLAGLFKLFGIYSAASAWAAVTLNCTFSALTCVPIVRVVNLSFGSRTGLFAGWIWAIFPYSIYLSADRIWSNALAALLMALLLWLTVRLDRKAATRDWLWYGLTWGLAGLTEPAILATLPCLLGWLIWRRHAQRLPSLAPATVTLVILLLVVAPWFVRNSVVFHRFIPFRSNFWLVLWQSNTGDTSDLYPDWANPPHNDAEMAEFQRVGELLYMQEKRTMALSELRAHPILHCWITVRRVAFFWTGFWTVDPTYRHNEPFQIPNTCFSVSLTAMMLAGLRSAWRRDFRAAAPLASVLLFFPMIFYITHPSIEYRHPVDPLVVSFIGLTIANEIDRRRVIGCEYILSVVMVLRLREELALETVGAIRRRKFGNAKIALVRRFAVHVAEGRTETAAVPVRVLVRGLLSARMRCGLRESVYCKDSLAM